MAPKFTPAELKQQVVEHYRDLRSQVAVKNTIVSKMLVNFMKQIGYDKADRERFIAVGMQQEALKIISAENARYRKILAAQGSKAVPIFGTKADKKDVAAIKKHGIDIEPGADIHKDCLTCPIEQLEDMIRSDIKSVTTPRRKVAYKLACYKLRTGLQYALPFDLPTDVEEEAMREAEDDMKKLQ